MAQYVTKESFQKMITLQKGYIDSKLTEKQNRFNIGNGLELVDGTLNVTLDTGIYKIVTELPAAPAAGDENKMFLVLKTGAEEGNTYIEYIYLSTENKWEKVGEWKPNVDLTPYLKSAELTANVTATGISLSKAGTKFAEIAFAEADFIGTKSDNKLSIALKNVIAAKASGFYKFQVDAKGRVIAVSTVAKEDITGLGFSTTEAMSQAITSAVEGEATARAAAVKTVADNLSAEIQNRTTNDATLAESVQAVSVRVKTLEDIEANREDLTVDETEALFNTVYSAGE